jgi:hypothetical protein
MAYHVEFCRYDGGKPVGKLGPFGNVESARQAILDHAGLTDLPARGPDYHIPLMRIVEGWIIGDIDYAITLAA